jgi:hypothetical protein
LNLDLELECLLLPLEPRTNAITSSAAGREDYYLG